MRERTSFSFLLSVQTGYSAWGRGGGLPILLSGHGRFQSVDGPPHIQTWPAHPTVFILQILLPIFLSVTHVPLSRAPQTQSWSPQVMSCPLFWCAQPIGLAA